MIVAIAARVTRAILERCGDIASALISGAAAEPELAAVLAEGRRRHRAGTEAIVDALVEHDALDASIDAEAAVDTIAALSDIGFGVTLRDTYGWSLDRIEEWSVATTRRTLLRRLSDG